MADSAEPPRSVEEVKAMLETTEKGGFRNSMSNCLTVFQCDPHHYHKRLLLQI